MAYRRRGRGRKSFRRGFKRRYGKRFSRRARPVSIGFRM